jgi:hypothetical protein
MPKSLNFDRPRGSCCSQWQGPRNPRTGDRMENYLRERVSERAIRTATVQRRLRKLDENPELRALCGAPISAAHRFKSGRAPITLPKLACLEKEPDAQS